MFVLVSLSSPPMTDKLGAPAPSIFERNYGKICRQHRATYTFYNLRSITAWHFFSLTPHIQ